jgi:hypothetical protein
MGAWGVGNFDNDDAADWVDELEDTEGLSLIVATLETVTTRGDEYLEAPDCCRALAAAEVVASLKNANHTALPEKAQQWSEAHRGTDGNQHAELALKAVVRIKTESELKELFDESEDAAEWYKVLDDLQSRLTP